VASLFEGGSIAVFRLAPQDYHRYHFPINGVLTETRQIDGPLYTVNPIAVNKVDVFTENQRTVSIFDSLEFGKVAFVCVGATLVGSIVHTHPLQQQFAKGDEFGFFQFGGSTTILLFQKGRVEYDADLLQHSGRSVEVLLKMGERIGRACSE
jgi:phosphatidylserine decarboxylase